MSGIGSLLQGLAPLQSGYYQGVDERMRRQMLEQQMLSQQQQQQGLAALANAYGNQQQTPPPAPPMTPPPGQQSQPMQPPQGQPPQGMQPPPRGMPPGMMPGRQMGPPQQQMGPPPQQAPQAPQVKPYTAPQPPQQVTPQQQAPQSQGIPPPPQVTQAVQSTMPDLETMASTLKKQGITGMALMAALQQHQQFLSVEGKQQLAQLQEQVRHMNAEAAMRRGGAAQQTADNGSAREDRLERGAQGETAMSSAKIEEMKAKVTATMARVNKSASSGKYAEPEDIDLIARGVAAGKIDPKSLSTKGGMREHVLERAMQINPDYDQKDYNADNAFGTSSMRTAGTSGANTAIAAGAAQGGADILMDAAAKVPRTNWKSINKLVIAGKTEASDPDTGAYLTALNTFVNEYARAVNPKGTATVSDKEHAREILSAAGSQDELEAKMGILRKEMQRGKQAPQDVARDLKSARKGGNSMSDQDKQALDWANANPSDPRAKQIKQRLGM